MSTRHALIKSRTGSFCRALVDPANNPPDHILKEHFTSDTPRITEHGPAWASKLLPFLGTTFTGHGRCLEYFRLLTDTLECNFDQGLMLDTDTYVVDAAAVALDHAGVVDAPPSKGAASVMGKAKFTAKQTGKGWEECFVYRLSDFDADGRIGHWEIWAVPLSAWVAVKGEATMIRDETTRP